MSSIRGRGRPTTGPILEVRIPVDLRDQLDDWANRAGVTRAEAIRRLLATALDAETAGDPTPEV